jgi:GTPase SAR1 family protein
MVQVNLALREINCKIVYFGCGLGGKTTNLEIVHQRVADDSRGELTSIATESDRTLFFDFMPLDIGEVSGMRVKFQLYTVPGQVYYNSTRKLVLRGADAVIFIADSQTSKRQENLDSLENLRQCLREQGRTLDETPHVIQFNKADSDHRMSGDSMERDLNLHGARTFTAVASTGEGVLETFKAMAKILLDRIRETVVAGAALSPASSATREAETVRPSRRERLAGGLSTPVQSGSSVALLRTQHRIENRSLDTTTTGVAITHQNNLSASATPATQGPRRNGAAVICSTLRTGGGMILSSSRREAQNSRSRLLLTVGAAVGIAGAALALIFFLL